jgi:hypothetical protein
LLWCGTTRCAASLKTAGLSDGMVASLSRVDPLTRMIGKTIGKRVLELYRKDTRKCPLVMGA